MHIHIIIPYHSEDKSLYQKIFSKLNNQENVDFNDISILICRSDGVGIFPDLSDWKNIQPITTFISKQTPLPGPGWSRQVGLEYIEKLNGDDDDWVLFFDTDDDLTDNNVLNKLIGYINANSDADDITFSYLRLGVNAPLAYLYTNPPWEVWATIYNLQFMKKYDIRCGLTFRVREDAFLTACRVSVPNAIHRFINDPYYVYTWGRETSTLNSDFSRYTGEDDLLEYIKFWNEFNDWKCEGKTYFYVFDMLLNPVKNILINIPLEIRCKYKEFIEDIKNNYQIQIQIDKTIYNNYHSVIEEINQIDLG